MYFANPWGLLALLALPVIAVIHLYHRRYPPLLVAGTHLWGAKFETRSPGRRRDRLPITASLLLELAAALLLSLLLSQPRIGDLDAATHLIVVLDNSASMQGRPPGEASFRDRAIEKLEQRIGRLSRGSRVTLILTGRRPTMLAGPAVPWPDARALLEKWQPSAPRHEFQPAWDRAAQFAEESGRLLFLTDTLPDAALVPRRMEVVALGEPLENVAITAARWTFDSQAQLGSVFLRIENLGRGPADVTVRGTANQQRIFARTLSIEPESGVPLEAEVPGGLGQLAITIDSPRDGLVVDNTVTLIEPKIRTVTLGMTLPQDSVADRLVRRVLEHVPDVQFGEAEAAHLLIAPASPLPESRADLWWLGIGPLDSSESARGQAQDLAGPFVIDKQHPLLDGVTLSGVIWGGAQPTELATTPLVSAGPYTLLGRLNGTRTTAYLLNIDLARSNLGQSPDWPILLANLVELRRESLPGLRRWNYRLNEEIRFRLYEGDAILPGKGSDELTLVHDGRTRPVARSSAVELPLLEETGVYEIRDGTVSIGRFAVNFLDPEESTLSELSAGVRDAAIEAEPATFRVDHRYSWLIVLGILAVIAAVLLDWKVLRSPQ